MPVTPAEPSAWALRAGVDDAFHTAEIRRGLVGLGWRRVGDLSGVSSEKDIRILVDRAYPDQQARTRKSTAVQLRVFRDLIRPGDVVVLHRAHTQEIAIGEVIGNYRHLSSPGPGLPSHVRDVRWLNPEVPRRTVDDDLLSMPALVVITRIGQSEAAARLREIARAPESRREPDDVAHAFATGGDTPADNLRRNLKYARDLADGGNALTELGVGSFDPDDMFRAAWTQAVTALDWWVSQEVRERILALVENNGGALPDRLRKEKIPFAVLDDVASGTLSVRDSVEKHFLDGDFARKSYQSYDAIREGLNLVLPSNTKLWPGVVTVLNEQTPGGKTYTDSTVKEELNRVAARRHRIVHEYDSAPDLPSGRNPITYEDTLVAINWIETLTSAINTVIEKY